MHFSNSSPKQFMSRFTQSHLKTRHNPPVDPVRFAHWTLRDEAAQRRPPAR
jgi:hypothetical protein